MPGKTAKHPKSKVKPLEQDTAHGSGNGLETVKQDKAAGDRLQTVKQDEVGGSGDRLQTVKQDKTNGSGNGLKTVKQDEAGGSGHTLQTVKQDRANDSGNGLQTTKQDNVGGSGDKLQPVKQDKTNGSGNGLKTVKQDEAGGSGDRLQTVKQDRANGLGNGLQIAKQDKVGGSGDRLQTEKQDKAGGPEEQIHYERFKIAMHILTVFIGTLLVVLVILVAVLFGILFRKVSKLEARNGELEEMLRNSSVTNSQRFVRETQLDALTDELTYQVQASHQLTTENITSLAEVLARQGQLANASYGELETRLENITGIDITDAFEQKIASLNATVTEFSEVVEQLSTQRESLVAQLVSVNESVQMLGTGTQGVEILTNISEISRRVQASLDEIETQQAMFLGQLAEAVRRIDSQEGENCRHRDHSKFTEKCTQLD